jgi:hypothetical protein
MPLIWLKNITVFQSHEDAENHCSGILALVLMPVSTISTCPASPGFFSPVANTPKKLRQPFIEHVHSYSLGFILTVSVRHIDENIRAFKP